MKKRWDILGIGVSSVDDLIYVDQFPQPDTKIRVRETQRQGGGLTGTALVAAARLGSKAAYCALVGLDTLSQSIIRELEQEKIDCSPCIYSADGRPFHSFIIVDVTGGTRTILAKTGRVEPPLEFITEELITSCRVLFIDHLVPRAGLQAAQIARVNGIPVVADIETDCFPEMEAFIAEVDHLIIGRSLAERITQENQVEEMVRVLSASKRQCCVVTAGEQGCWYSIRGGSVIHYPAFQVQVLDTTGCGDVFHGAYTASIAKGECIERAVAIATVAAGLKAAHPGGRTGIPDLKTVTRYLTENTSE
jgi:sulfofructose kinase